MPYIFNRLKCLLFISNESHSYAWHYLSQNKVKKKENTKDFLIIFTDKRYLGGQTRRKE